MKVGEDMLKTDLKRDFPPDLKGDALRKWAYQIYIKDYLRCIQSVDDNVGRVLDYLDAEGLANNTIVIYTSDQGFFLGDHGWFDKRLMYEESLRMPFLMRYPGAIRPGTVNRDMVLNIDFAPMFLDYAGVRTPAEMQGRSFRANLEGHTPRDWRKSMYYRYWMHNTNDHHVPGALRRAHRSLEAHLLLRQAARHEGRQSARYHARLGTLRRAQRPARDAQSLSRPQIRARSKRHEALAGQATKRSRRPASVG